MSTEQKKKDPIGAIIVWLSVLFILFVWIAYPILNMPPSYENLFVVKGSVNKIDESCSRYKFSESCFDYLKLLHRYGTIKIKLSENSHLFKIGDQIEVKTSQKPSLFSEFHIPYEITKGSRQVVRFEKNIRTKLAIKSGLKILFCLFLIWLYFNQDRIMNTIHSKKESG